MNIKNNLILFFGIGTLIISHSISAGSVYCPTSLICDNNVHCTTNENNGHTNWAIVGTFSYTPGAYYFIMAESNPWSTQFSSCWYTNTKNIYSSIILSSQKPIFASGPNWSSANIGAPYCPTGRWGEHEFMMPQACAFTTTPPPPPLRK